MKRDAEHLLDLAGQALAAARKEGATAADVAILDGTDINAAIRNGQPETIERAETCGLGLRVFVGERSAMQSTSDLRPEALAELAARVTAIANAAPPDPHASLADANRLAHDWPDLDLADNGEPSVEALQQYAREAEEAGLAHSAITNSEGAEASFGRHLLVLATSHGFAGHYVSSRAALAVSLIGGRGDAMQRDYAYGMAAHLADLASPTDIGAEAAKRTAERLNPRKLGTRQAAVFFEPRIGRSLLGAFAGAISGAAVARGTSFLKERLGKQIFAKDIAIIDDPLRKRGLASHPFDGEGVAVTKQAMVQDGVLQSWLLDTRSARQLGMESTGHAARGLSSAPSPSASNLYLEAGEKTPEELYKEAGSGLLVTETIGHGTNLVTGDFSVGASGFWIEHGAIAYPVSEITIAGNLSDMFRELVPANDLTFRYAVNTPTILVPRMTIAGNG